MALRAFGASRGLLLGAIDGLLGTHVGLQIDPKGLTRFGPFRVWALFGICLSFLAADDGLESVVGPSWSATGSSWALSGTSYGALRCDVDLWFLCS